MINVCNITIAQFQTQFPTGVGGYSYLPTWLSTTNYFTGDIVYYDGNFYKATADNVDEVPPNITFWIPYNANVYSYISDTDITNAFLIAQGLFSTDIFCGDPDPFVTMAYCLLVAHIILYFIKPQELTYTGQTPASLGAINSQHVGNVSLTRAIPNSITSDIFYTGLNTTIYGQQYLMIIDARSAFQMVYSFGGIPN